MECNIKVCLNSELLKIFFLKSGFGGPHTTTLPWVIPLRVSPCNTRILKSENLEMKNPRAPAEASYAGPPNPDLEKGKAFGYMVLSRKTYSSTF